MEALPLKGLNGFRRSPSASPSTEGTWQAARVFLEDFIVAQFGYLVLAAFATQASAQSAPPAAEIKVAKVDFAGEGCPASTPGTASISQDGAAVAIGTPVFAARLDGAKRLVRSACSVTLEVNHPIGWQLKPDVYELTTESSLVDGVKGDMSVVAHYQGEPENANARKDVVGVLPKTSHQLPFTEQWSRCAGKSHTTIVLSAALKVVAGKPAATGHLSALSGQTLHLAWRKCP